MYENTNEKDRLLFLRSISGSYYYKRVMRHSQGLLYFFKKLKTLFITY
uniref:Uncharacterized protein n=1 Tax=virus sp. ct9pU4 TaxID=2828248 RepID=A0A8S5RBH4_9VIRU|nr:MAG TPA: hypothetical protein [virus sp. ct9pU4]DAK20384.1 MAG TPA: hypothetical protein [Bacteriophage sp.]